MQKKSKDKVKKLNKLARVYKVLKTDIHGLAKLLKISASNISSWNTGKMEMPLKHALKIQVLSKGILQAPDLSPLAYKKIYGVK